MKSPQERDLEFINLAIAHEEAMATLYDLFRDKVPQSAKLWEALAREERLHAERFRLLAQEVEADRAYLGDTRPKLAGVKASLESIKGKAAMWRRDGVSKDEAYEYAMLLEGGMVEDSLFETSDDDSLVAQRILFEMKSGTHTHFHRIREEYQANSMSAGFLTHVRAKFKSLFGDR